jgi:Tat protein translocase TatB subunit
VPVLLILDSLGTSELLLILAVALIFFGPRKLPQISRQIGKAMAEFKRHSEDFKRTWEREVALESARSEPEPDRATPSPDHSIIETTVERGNTIHNAAAPEESAAYFESAPETVSIPTETTSVPTTVSSTVEPARIEPSSKRDWL